MLQLVRSRVLAGSYARARPGPALYLVCGKPSRGLIKLQLRNASDPQYLILLVIAMHIYMLAAEVQESGIFNRYPKRIGPSRIIRINICPWLAIGPTDISESSPARAIGMLDQMACDARYRSLYRPRSDSGGPRLPPTARTCNSVDRKILLIIKVRTCTNLCPAWAQYLIITN